MLNMAFHALKINIDDFSQIIILSIYNWFFFTWETSYMIFYNTVVMYDFEKKIPADLWLTWTTTSTRQMEEFSVARNKSDLCSVIFHI